MADVDMVDQYGHVRQVDLPIGIPIRVAALFATKGAMRDVDAVYQPGNVTEVTVPVSVTVDISRVAARIFPAAAE
jgi:hypothetical protein